MRTKISEANFNELISGIEAAHIIRKKLSTQIDDPADINITFTLNHLENFEYNEKGGLIAAGIIMHTYCNRFFKLIDIKNYIIDSENIFLSLRHIRNRPRWIAIPENECLELFLDENSHETLRAIHPEKFWTNPSPENGTSLETHYGPIAQQLIENGKALYYQSDIEALERELFKDTTINIEDPKNLKDAAEQVLPKLISKYIENLSMPMRSSNPNFTKVGKELYDFIVQKQNFKLLPEDKEKNIKNLTKYANDDFKELLTKCLQDIAKAQYNKSCSLNK